MRNTLKEKEAYKTNQEGSSEDSAEVREGNAAEESLFTENSGSGSHDSMNQLALPHLLGWMGISTQTKVSVIVTFGLLAFRLHTCYYCESAGRE